MESAIHDLSRRRCACRFVLLTVLLAAAASSPASAQPVQGRFLRSLVIGEDAEEYRLKVEFTVPIRYLRHTPVSEGSVVLIQLQPVAATQDDPLARFSREALRPPPDVGIPVEEVLYQGGRDEPVLEIRFKSRQRFEVLPGRDVRSIMVRVAKPQAAARPSPPRAAAPPLAPAPPEALALLEQARSALTAGDPAAAVPPLTRLLELPPNTLTPEAKELLGVARERNGQLAHAKAEYEEYLEAFPGTEGEARVRQRLDALLTAHEPPRIAGAEPARRREQRRLDWDAYGSLSTYYRRDYRETDLLGGETVNSSLANDLFAGARLETSNVWVRSELSSSYLYDFLDPATDDLRVRSAFIEMGDQGRRMTGVAGRQTANNAGVLGRFDGLRLHYQLDESGGVGMVAGFPVELFVSNKIDTNRYFVGMSGDVSLWSDRVQAELFAIHQRSYGEADRTAIGGELRYADAGRYLALYVDYDLYFRSLNTATLIGNWQIDPRTHLNLFADYRNSPVVTANNALIGQPVERLSELSPLFDLRELALDRTGTARVVTLGGTRRLTDRVQLAGDISVSEFTSTRESAGVPATEGTGLEPSVFAQLIVDDLLLSGDAGVVGVRYLRAKFVDTTSLNLSMRIPFTRGLRLYPRLTADWRQQKREGLQDTLTLRPSLRIDYRWRALTLEMELGFEWTHGERFEDSGDERAYLLSAGFRWDF